MNSHVYTHPNKMELPNGKMSTY